MVATMVAISSGDDLNELMTEANICLTLNDYSVDDCGERLAIRNI